MNLQEKVYRLLIPLGVPVQYLIRPPLSDKGYVISFHFYNEQHLIEGDGRGRMWGGRLQLDLFSKQSTREHFRTISGLLSKAGFVLFDAYETDEALKGIKLYHGVILMSFADERIIEYEQT